MKEIFVFTLLVVLTVPALIPVNRFITGRMEEFRNTWISRAEAYLGRTISYSSMGPSIFGSVDIRNIQVTGADGLPVFSVYRFRLLYSFLDLLLGRADALRSVRIEKPEIFFKKERDGDLLALFSGAPPAASAEKRRSREDMLSRIPEKLLFRIRNGRADIDAGENRFRTAGLNFDLSAEGGRIEIRGRWRAALSLTLKYAGSFNAEMTGKLSGSFTPNLREGDVSLDLPSLRGELFKMNALGVDLSLRGGIVSVRKKADDLPYDFSADYGKDLLSVRANFDNFVPGDLLFLSGNLRKYNQVLSTVVAGKAELRREGGELGYTADLRGSLPQKSGE
ncbi:MAG: hypothetical protein LBD71_02055, partial [Treponema sp.]|nr:hypothetical protein [Treponema sp.]